MPKRMYKKVGGVFYSLNNVQDGYGFNSNNPPCTCCDLKGIGGRCMVGKLPECNQKGNFFLSHLGKRLV